MKWRQLATEQAAREVREGALVNAGLKKLSLAVGLRNHGSLRYEHVLPLRVGQRMPVLGVGEL